MCQVWSEVGPASVFPWARTERPGSGAAATERELESDQEPGGLLGPASPAFLQTGGL